MKSIFKTIVHATVIAASFAMVPWAAHAQKSPEQATHPFTASKPIEGRYIVVFTSDVSKPAQEAANLLRGTNATLHHTFSNAPVSYTHLTLPTICSV